MKSPIATTVSAHHFCYPTVTSVSVQRPPTVAPLPPRRPA
jgi:hypothetical protein